MVIEQIRRPQEFLEVVARAHEAGKPLVALKIGRSPGGQRASASHTGALMADAREYDIAFRQLGIEIARDLPDVLGRLQLFSHFPRERWARADKVAVLSHSGGAAAVVADTFHDESLPLPQDEAINARAREMIPSTISANPLDVTGLYYSEEGIAELLDMYLASPTYDTVVAVGYLQEGMEAFGTPMTLPLRRAAATTDKRLIATVAADTSLGGWAESLLDDGVAVGAGVGSTVRSLGAMHRFVERRSRPRPDPVEAIPPPPASAVVLSEGSKLLTFTEGMRLLDSFGIPTAPYAIWNEPGDPLPEGDRYVVKLADVPHRTEHGAVRIGVTANDIADAAAELRAIARSDGLPDAIVVQPQLQIDHELFLGLQGTSTFGPLILFGIGGIFVELLHDITMRLAPITNQDAHDMLNELTAGQLLDEFRGRPGIDRQQLSQILVNAGRLAAATSTWLETLDINPLIGNTTGLAAVGVACIVA
jgi:acyl-CoA synthetase (NDP forming)